MSHPSTEVPLSLRVATDDRAPLYEQLTTQLRFLIAGGVLVAGQRMPSIRSVSTSLMVNPLTVSKAYAALENECLIVKAHGSGAFVSDVVAERFAPADRLALLKPILAQLAQQARILGVSSADVVDSRR